MQPLAQKFTVIGRSPERHVFTMEPGLIKLPGGKLLATFPYLSHLRQELRPDDYRPPTLNICVSNDGGASWQLIGERNWVTATPFLVDGVLYLMGHLADRQDVVITRSTDEGKSWARESTLFKGHFWNCPTGIVFRNGHIYRALGGNEAAGRETLVIAGDLSQDLLRTAAWRMSNRLPYPGTPKELVRNGKSESGHWLEPNVVEVYGRLYVLSTVKITSEDGWTTPGLAALCELQDDGMELTYRFLQYYPTPGGQLKFHIIYDEFSRLYWRTMNLPTDTSNRPDPRWQARGNFGGDRRILALSYGTDALNWVQAASIAATPRPWEGFQYAMPLIDGDDLLVVSRTSLNGVNQHDTNLVTLHRVTDFRSLALSGIHPAYE